jgi:hypothetical protein
MIDLQHLPIIGHRPDPERHRKFVLVAFEKSGTVGREFSTIPGVYVLTCDIQEPYEHWPIGPDAGHYTGDVYDVLNLGWDAIIAHPPCTYMTNAGAWCLHRPDKFPDRWQQLQDAAIMFWDVLHAEGCPLIAVENPVMVKYAKWIVGRDQDFTFQPFHHGDPISKLTCIWSRGLPKLKKTEVLNKADYGGYWENQTPSGQNKLGPSADRGDRRSDFSPRVARAMRDQWMPYILGEKGATA